MPLAARSNQQGGRSEVAKWWLEGYANAGSQRETTYEGCRPQGVVKGLCQTSTMNQAVIGTGTDQQSRDLPNIGRGERVTNNRLHTGVKESGDSHKLFNS